MTPDAFTAALESRLRALGAPFRRADLLAFLADARPPIAEGADVDLWAWRFLEAAPPTTTAGTPIVVEGGRRGSASLNLQHVYDLDTAEWWDDRRGAMAPLHWMTPARFAYFAEVASPLHGKAVLDLGCGGGLLAERFADAGARVVGVDQAPSCVRAAREHARQTARAITYLQMKCERLAFADASFDVVVAADVLEHVPDLSGVLAEVSRVLRPGGVFVFDTINRTCLARRGLVWLAERVLRLVPRGAHDPALFIRPRELAVRLAGAGLRLKKVVGLGPVGYRQGRIRFGRVPLTLLSYMGSARKPVEERR